MGVAAAAGLIIWRRPAPRREREGFDSVDSAKVQEWLTQLAKRLGAGVASTRLSQELDDRDRLAEYREEFHFPRVAPSAGAGGAAALYFVGNSLGLQPKAVRAEVEHHLQEWEDRAVEGHFTGPQPWMPIEDSTRSMMASVVGALPEEVVCMNTLSVNLHIGMTAFYRPTDARHKILVERRCFPSDDYAVQSQARIHGYDPQEAIVYFERREGEENWRTEDLVALLEREGDSIALVLLGGVQYLTGELMDIAAITAAAHQAGSKIGWDLAHAVGNAPLSLHDHGADFACWCTYKYLNAGPGGIGGFFVHQKHHTAEPPLPRLAGWWGHRREERFAMHHEFVPTPGAYGYQLSNPSVLCMASLLASLRIFDRATMPAIRRKSLLLTGYLELLLRECGLAPARCAILTPTATPCRGCQLSLRFDCDVDGIEQRLRERGVMVDTRKPDVMRVAPVPLYNSFEDVRRFVKELVAVVGTTPPRAGWALSPAV